MDLPNRILFVGAHCDDVELFAGGLLARACRTGRDVGVMVFSDHRGVVDDDTAAKARAELRANLEWLEESTSTAVVDHSELWLPACRGAFEAERAAIYAAMEAVRDHYDMVVTHPLGDTNQDHEQVAREARRVFKMHATVLSGEFPANDAGTFEPRVYVGLDEEDLAVKIRLISRYETQRRAHRTYLDGTVVKALARIRGAQIGRAAAEAFEVLARIVVTE
jgi:LmbE family N-acetylglucosaminyl deacetylase